MGGVWVGACGFPKGQTVEAAKILCVTQSRDSPTAQVPPAQIAHVSCLQAGLLEILASLVFSLKDVLSCLGDAQAGLSSYKPDI